MTSVLGLIATPQGFYVLLSKLLSATAKARVLITAIIHCLLIHGVAFIRLLCRTRFSSPLGIRIAIGSRLTTIADGLLANTPGGECGCRCGLLCLYGRDVIQQL